MSLIIFKVAVVFDDSLLIMLSALSYRVFTKQSSIYSERTYRPNELIKYNLIIILNNELKALGVEILIINITLFSDFLTGELSDNLFDNIYALNLEFSISFILHAVEKEDHNYLVLLRHLLD